MDTKKILYQSTLGVSVAIALSGCISSKETASLNHTEGEKQYCELKNFTATCIDGRVYINWIVNTNISNYYFILEKSDGVNTEEVVYVKKGFSSPANSGVSYSFTDKNLKTSSCTYKLRAVQPVKSGEGLLLYANNRNLFNDLENDEIRVEYRNNTITVNKH